VSTLIRKEVLFKMVKKKKVLASLDMDTVFSIGLIKLAMKDNGDTIKLKGKEHSCINKETFIREIFKMIWLMVMVNIFILMAQLIKDNLSMMFKRVMVRNNGLMEPNTLDNMLTVLNMVKVFINGQMEALMTAHGNKIKYLALEYIHGLMEENMKATGKIII